MESKILIVDDDGDLRSSLASVLRPFYKILEASNGAEAMELIKKQRPGLVFLDVSLQGPSGLEILELARAMDPLAMIVMLTGHHEVELARRALNLGAIEYVTKPFDADYIRAEVSRLFGTSGKEPEQKPWKIVQ